MPVRIITEEQKGEMIRLYNEDGFKQEAIANMFNIASSTVFGIVSGGQRQKTVEECAMQYSHHEKYRQRFWSRVNLHGGYHNNMPDECWTWGGGHDQEYGIYRAGPKRYYTHVYSWEIDKGQELGVRRLMHLCKNRGCCNPRHLKLNYTTSNSGSQAYTAGNQAVAAKAFTPIVLLETGTKPVLEPEIEAEAELQSKPTGTRSRKNAAIEQIKKPVSVSI